MGGAVIIAAATFAAAILGVLASGVLEAAFVAVASHSEAYVTILSARPNCNSDAL